MENKCLKHYSYRGHVIINGLKKRSKKLSAGEAPIFNIN
jgi:hypothetical protein